MLQIYGKQAARAAAVKEENVVPALKIALLVKLQQPCESLAGVYGVKYNAFLLCHELYGINACGGWNSIARAVALEYVYILCGNGYSRLEKLRCAVTRISKRK